MEGSNCRTLGCVEDLPMRIGDVDFQPSNGCVNITVRDPSNPVPSNTPYISYTLIVRIASNFVLWYIEYTSGRPLRVVTALVTGGHVTEASSLRRHQRIT